MSLSKQLKIFPPLAVLALATGSTNAATITGVTIEDFSSELFPSFDRAAAYTLNGVGYTAGVQNTHSASPDGPGGLGNGTMWLSNGTFSGGTDPLPAQITFDLGNNYDLSSMTVWNYNEQAAGLRTRGANSVNILVASSVGGPFTSLGNFTFDIAPGNDSTLFGQDIALTAAAADDTRLIRFDILTNHGGDNNFAGLSEVRFDGVIATTPVPEPTTTALLGLGGLALAFRRHRK